MQAEAVPSHLNQSLPFFVCISYHQSQQPHIPVSLARHSEPFFLSELKAEWLSVVRVQEVKSGLGHCKRETGPPGVASSDSPIGLDYRLRTSSG